MIKVKEIMQKSLITVKQDTSMSEVINILGQKKITGLPVVDDENNLIGIISEKDILAVAYRMIDYGTENTVDKKVKDYMTTNVVSFKSDDNLADVCQCFINNPFRRVPIVDKGKIVGLVSRKDIISYAFTHCLVQSRQEVGCS